MKALSLLQPWASLVIIGAKRLETRSWSTKYRGDLLIHASTGRAGALLTFGLPFSKYIRDFNQLPFGAIIGQVNLTDVVSVEQLPLSDAAINHLTLEERAFGDYTKGRFAWVLEEPIQFSKPIPLKGTLGLWEYSGPL
jgi:activating signal cointegrator 1